MITVCAGVAFNKDKILIARRKNGGLYQGLFEFPGGKLEKGETPYQCIVREIEEELCVKSRVKSFLKEIIHDYPDKRVKLLFFEIELQSLDICLKVHDKILWEDIENLHDYDFLEADIPFINFLQKKFSR